MYALLPAADMWHFHIIAVVYSALRNSSISHKFTLKFPSIENYTCSISTVGLNVVTNKVKKVKKANLYSALL